MGTRADFYVGRGENAEWLGSIAWDGHHDTLSRLGLFEVANEQAWRERVSEELYSREDGTRPEHGWPWPWENSQTTDYAYAFDGDRVWGSCCGRAWFDATKPKPKRDDEDQAKSAVFPRMKTERYARAGSERSGVMVFTSRKGGGGA